MARLIGRDDGETAALLYGLALLGLIEARPRLAAQPPAPAGKTATVPTPREDAETRSLREKISTQLARIASLSFYQILGVTPDSDPDTIKRSYLAIAKEYHPDRFFGPEFADLQEAAHAIFMHVNEAYATLHDPTARAAYDREALRLTTPAARRVGPARGFPPGQGAVHQGARPLNAGDLWSAIQALRWATNLAPLNPRYHTWLGVALMRTKKRLHEAAEHCTDRDRAGQQQRPVPRAPRPGLPDGTPFRQGPTAVRDGAAARPEESGSAQGNPRNGAPSRARSARPLSREVTAHGRGD